MINDKEMDIKEMLERVKKKEEEEEKQKRREANDKSG